MEFKDIMNHAPQNQANFNDLLRYCQSGKVVPFIGAGLSDFANRKAGFTKQFYTWWKYLSIHYKKSYGKELDDNADLYRTADEIEEEETPKLFYENIRITFGGNLNDDEWHIILEKADNEAVSVIPKLFKGPIITSNFDQILEKVCNTKLDDVYLPHSTDTLEKISKTIKYTKRSIYKIHGTVSDVEHIVFTGKSYDKAYSLGTPLVKTLSDFYKGFCFLFLGCSLKMSEDEMDKSIKLWTKITHSGMFHYAILACGKENEEKDKQKERLRQLEQYNIKPIFFPENKFESIKIILDALLEQSRKFALKIPDYHSCYIETLKEEDLFIKTIEKKLNTTANASISQVTLSGMGGIGKTRLACEYAKQHARDYLSGRFFINAYSRESIQAQIYMFAEQILGLVGKNDYADILSSVQLWMRNNDNWLFLLDNVEHYEDIEDLLIFSNNNPSDGKRHFIITSRKSYSEIEDIELKIFDEPEALKFFYTHTGKEPDEYTTNIAVELGHLPLALEQAASYIKKQNISYQKYSTLIKISKTEVLSKGEYEGNSLPIQATFNVSMRMITDEAAKQLLNLCSFFAPENISVDWFRKANKQVNLHPLQNKIKDDIEFQAILNELEEYSLIKFENSKINAHRLIQEVVNKTLNKKKHITTCIRILDKVIITNFSTAQNRLLFYELVPHVTSILNQITWNANTIKVSNLYSFSGVGYYEYGDFPKAFNHLSKALKINENKFGKKHSKTADAINNMAALLKAMGYYKKAESLFRRALKIDTTVYGHNSFEVALDKNNLAESLLNIKINEAEKLFRDALKTYEDSNDPDITLVLNNLAELLRESGRYKEAESLYRRALKIDKDTYGFTSQEVSTDLNNLALLLEAIGQYEEAEQLSRDALQIDTDIYGENHHRVAKDLSSLAIIIEHRNCLGDAEEFYLRALQINEDTFGQNHPEVSRDLNNLALLYEATNRSKEAESLYNRALRIDKDCELKPDLARDLNAIAGLYANTKRGKKAEQYYRRALKIYEKHNGVNSLEVAIVSRNLATLLCDNKRFIEAEILFLSNLNILLKSTIENGILHPNLEDAFEYYVNVLKLLGKLKDNEHVSFEEWIKFQLK
jgi:tetratricopeptide (TPR) repeat protein